MTEAQAWEQAGRLLLEMERLGLLVEEPPQDAYGLAREAIAGALLLQGAILAKHAPSSACFGLVDCNAMAACGDLVVV